MLVWNLFIAAGAVIFASQASNLMRTINKRVFPYNDILTTVVGQMLMFLEVIVVALLSGWLADSRCGNYKIFKIGSSTLFVAAVINCFASILILNFPISGIKFAIIPILLAFVYGIAIYSVFAYFPVLLQLGLDQMPDASSENITSFIFWYLGSLMAGLWMGSSVYTLMSNCISQTSLVYSISSLLPVLSTCCVLCSDFLLGRKWLIIESSSPQSLKHIFRVLKFAAKHKAPLNRSALTYWEEDIPSRMDLAKTRYGGPFTTEQVEDVKTFLKLLIVLLPLCLIVPGLVAHGFDVTHMNSVYIHKVPLCAAKVIYVFSYNPLWCAILGALLYEVCIWPLINIRLPSLLKRIGIASVMTILLNIAYLCWTIASSHVTFPAHTFLIFDAVYTILAFFTLYHLLASVFEFICAQSPYSARALMIGYTVVIVALSFVIAFLLVYGFYKICSNNCSLIHDSIALAMAIVGFILHCILAHWYKRRVRDDIDTPHRWVEEVYDRYLSHNAYH